MLSSPCDESYDESYKNSSAVCFVSSTVIIMLGILPKTARLVLVNGGRRDKQDVQQKGRRPHPDWLRTGSQRRQGKKERTRIDEVQKFPDG
jgi:hypothetical protein